MSLPSLVITGEHDLTVKTKESIRLARELPCAELVVIPDCGHLPHEEQSEAFLLAVRKFLKSVAQENQVEENKLDFQHKVILPCQ